MLVRGVTYGVGQDVGLRRAQQLDGRVAPMSQAKRFELPADRRERVALVGIPILVVRAHGNSFL